MTRDGTRRLDGISQIKPLMRSTRAQRDVGDISERVAFVILDSGCVRIVFLSMLVRLANKIVCLLQQIVRLQALICGICSAFCAKIVFFLN